MIISIEDIKEYWLEMVLFIIMIYVLYSSILLNENIYDRNMFSCLPNPFKG